MIDYHSPGAQIGGSRGPGQGGVGGGGQYGGLGSREESACCWTA
jgi:hypothetical protein